MFIKFVKGLYLCNILSTFCLKFIFHFLLIFLILIHVEVLRHFMLCLFTFFFLMIVLKRADDSMQNAFTGSRYKIKYMHLCMYSLWRKPLYNGSSCIYSDELKIKIDVRCKCRCKVVHVLKCMYLNLTRIHKYAFPCYLWLPPYYFSISIYS